MYTVDLVVVRRVERTFGLALVRWVQRVGRVRTDVASRCVVELGGDNASRRYGGHRARDGLDEIRVAYNVVGGDVLHGLYAGHNK